MGNASIYQTQTQINAYLFPLLMDILRHGNRAQKTLGSDVDVCRYISL